MTTAVLEKMQQRSATREELYELVWSRPIYVLAKDYGVSDRGLSKACERLNVPTPPRGYWPKLAAGHSVSKPQLPQQSEGVPHVHVFRRKAAAQNPGARRNELLRAAGKLDLLDVKISVPKRLAKPHPVIARWIREREETRALDMNYRDGWSFAQDPGAFTPNDRRRHRLLHAFFKFTELHGGRIEERAKGKLFVLLGNDEVEISLREKNRQVRLPLEADQRPSPGGRLKQILEPTGLMLFEIKCHSDIGGRTSWIENEETALETSIGEFVVGLFAALQAAAERRLARAEQARAYQLRQSERAAAQRSIDDERQRWSELVQRARDWEERKLVSEFIREYGLGGGYVVELRGDIEEQTCLEWIEHRLAPQRQAGQ